MLLVFPAWDGAGLQVFGRDLFDVALVPKKKITKASPEASARIKHVQANGSKSNRCFLQPMVLLRPLPGGVGSGSACAGIQHQLWCQPVPGSGTMGSLVSPLPPSHTHLALLFPSPHSFPHPCTMFASDLSISVYMWHPLLGREQSPTALPSWARLDSLGLGSFPNYCFK